MRTLAIINQKGGCGKTTVAINLAACLAKLGHKTLLVDMDPQGHCATGLAVPDDQIERTVLDALLETGDLGSTGPVSIKDMVWQIASGFDLAPSDLKLAGFEQLFAGRSGREKRLESALAEVADGYEWCILDCPPGVGLLTFNALVACDEAIVPVETGYFSLHGLARMVETLEELKEQAGKTTNIRVLPTLYDTRTKLAREVLAELRGRFSDVLMRSCVNFNSKLKEAASFGQPITEYDPGSRGYKDFVDLARELMGQPEVAVVPGATDGPLSRPAELVHRARQLAQFSAKSFGREAKRVPAVEAEATPPASTPGFTFGTRQNGQYVDCIVSFPGARSVQVAGDFNDWNPSTGRLTKLDADGDAWHCRLPAKGGRHRYRYVVDGEWLNDPHGGEIERNEFGEYNNILIVKHAQPQPSQARPATSQPARQAVAA